MDGVLVIDKPQGLTSHDVVAVARRALREKRIGHTGTLDPLATGVLPLACGRATRLVRFLIASSKDYVAVVRFGLTTDSYDVTGTETGRSDERPTSKAVELALAPLRGDYLQMPPAYSAKKVDGQRAYALARRDIPVTLTAVPVTVSRAELLACTGDTATIAVTCTAGFYVRSFAQSLGERLGMGACLEALRRTRSGDFGIDNAVTLDTLLGPGPEPSGQPPQGVTQIAGLTPMDALLPGFPRVEVTGEGRRRVTHGRELTADHVVPDSDSALSQPAAGSDAGRWVRLLDSEGHLLALAERDSPTGALHPSVVLI